MVSETIEVQWQPEDLIPVVNDCYHNPSEGDPRVVYVGCNFTDPLGEVVSYQYSAIHSDGTRIDGERGSEKDNELRFPKKGEWTLEAVATDNDGNSSLPHTWQLNMDWDFDLPVADFQFERTGAYHFSVSEDRSYPKGAVRAFLSATHESGEELDFEFEGTWFAFDVNRRGNWTLEYRIMDGFGLVSKPVKASLYIDEIILKANISEIIESPRMYTLDTSGSYDPLNPLSLIGFKLRGTHESGDVFELNIASNTAQFGLPKIGTWKLEIFGVDTEHGVESGYFAQEILVQNQIPIANFNLSHGSRWDEVLLDASLSQDLDGNIVSFSYKFLHESGVEVSAVFEDAVHSITLRLEGEWQCALIVNDTEHGVSVEKNEMIVLENPRPIASVVQSAGWAWNEVFMNASASYDPDGYIASYNYRFIHEGGETQTFSTSNVIEIFTLAPIEGIWRYELEVVDGDGAKSEVFAGTFELVEPNEIPVANFSLEETLDPYTVKLISSSYDPDGSIESVEFSGTNERGDSIDNKFTDPPYLLTLSSGFWNISAVVIDNKGEKSFPVYLTVEIRPIKLNLEIAQGSTPYSYIMDASGTIKKGDVWLNVVIYRDGAVVYSEEHYELVKEINIFNKNGTYDIIVSATDGVYTTQSVSRTIVQTLPALDGDIIPEDPGDLADTTLLGVDSDGDGVRDDIELWVNSINQLSALQKATLKHMSAIMQKHIVLGDDKEASISAKYEEILYDYCVEYRFGREPASENLSNLRVKFYNTRERLLSWAKGEVNFAGQGVVLDTNEEGYEQYCD